MGTTSSTPTTTTDPATSNPDQTPVSGVRITGTAIKSHEELLQDAYNRGKIETLATLDELAAQVYERATNKIVEAENASLQHSEQILKNLQSRLKAPPKHEIKFCSTPRDSLLQCLQENKEGPLACNRFVDEYYSCATQEFESN
mmetsp:Transcript_1368/g.1449  ORF Transcript_1368/g.1449 Transcript_1368/m.1449 type:complete len:144 (+) Transcript_1368:49-480(+)|eukprot:gene12122-13252_t